MKILDSGDRREFETGFVRDMGEGKGRMDLLPWDAIMELSKHSERGAKKYSERNIDLGCPQHSLLDSAMRHLAKYVDGETDENHLLAGFWNIAWAVHQELKRPDMLDLPRHQKSEEQSEDPKDIKIKNLNAMNDKLQERLRYQRTEIARLHAKLGHENSTNAKEEYICGMTLTDCSFCQPGPCSFRVEVDE